MKRIKQCKDCKNEISESMHTCSHCGSTDFHDVEQIEHFNTKLEIKDWKVVAIIFLVVVISVKFITNKTIEKQREYREVKQNNIVEPKKEHKSRRVEDNNVHAAWAYIQIYVESQLKSPNTADFRFGGYRDVTYLGNGLYSFNSYVDSENSFGAKIRTYFSGTIQEVPGGWAIQTFQFK